MHYLNFDSPVGRIYLESDANYLTNLYFAADLPNNYSNSSSHSDILLQAKEQLNEYFTGRRKIFDLPTKQVGTKFQQQVWQTISQIPYGEVVSYKDLAQQISNPKAYRAVANACGRNSLPIIIPCHRVIASAGKLGGFSAGLAIKKKLLLLENISSCF